MIRLKLEREKKNGIILKVGIVNKEEVNNPIIRRVLFEGQEIKGGRKYNYIIPLKFLIPIVNNINNEEVVIEKSSLLSYIEYSDEYDEHYYYIQEVTPSYMKNWRKCGCPKIYKVTLDVNKNSVNKEVIFNKISSILN